MNNHEKINYVEFPAKNLTETKKFFTATFGWEFIDYGDSYTAFSNQGLDGGFYYSEMSSTAEKGAALIVFYSAALEDTLEKTKKNGGLINKEIFSFPGGRRFHFIEPSGNEFAVWSEP